MRRLPRRARGPARREHRRAGRAQLPVSWRGRLADALAERALSRVWAVDASAEMVARAKALGVNARLARAEALPFKRGWFYAAVMRMSVHLVDRPRAFAEIQRILSPAGRLAIATEDPDHFEDVWFARWFRPCPRSKSGFPDEPTLRSELTAAGLADLRSSGSRSNGRSPARGPEIMRARFYSTSSCSRRTSMRRAWPARNRNSPSGSTTASTGSRDRAPLVRPPVRSKISDAVREPANVAAVGGHHVELVLVVLRVRAVGRERDRLAVRRPGGRAVVRATDREPGRRRRYRSSCCTPRSASDRCGGRGCKRRSSRRRATRQARRFTHRACVGTRRRCAS